MKATYAQERHDLIMSLRAQQITGGMFSPRIVSLTRSLIAVSINWRINMFALLKPYTFEITSYAATCDYAQVSHVSQPETLIVSLDNDPICEPFPSVDPSELDRWTDDGGNNA